MQHPSRGIVAALILAAMSACAESSSPTDVATEIARPQFARTGDKFLFPNVTFPDGTVGFIGAHTKGNTNKGETYTRCDYYAEDWAAHLGGYADETLPAESLDDPDAILAFCLSHYDDRS